MEQNYRNIQNKIIIRRDDCNTQLLKLSRLLKEKKNYASLVFLDPFGMQIEMNSLKKFKNTHSDLWILLPSGVAVNRLLPKNGVIRHVETLEKLFGESIETLREYFYNEQKENSLFGVESKLHKISRSIEGIAGLYVNKLKSIWDYVTQEPLILLNSKNSPLYHFIFASNNPTAYRIASYIISRKRLK